MHKVEIGLATLYLGDCADILPTLGQFDAVVTDPPYGIKFASQPTIGQRKIGMKPMDWDNKTPDLSNLLNNYKKVAIWGANYFELPSSRGWIAWCKPDAPPSMGNLELCWTNLDKNSKHIIQSISATNKERVGHPTQKPLKVIEFTIDFIGDCETIIDPYMGSGTTGVACAKMGKTFIGIEKEPKYFDIACKRIEQAQAQERLFA
jgi:site-specific DNA-methyltransferase (adenine-specific)